MKETKVGTITILEPESAADLLTLCRLEAGGKLDTGMDLTLGRKHKDQPPWLAARRGGSQKPGPE